MNFLLTLVSIIVIIAVLSLAKGVLIPIALAILVTFLLTPVVGWLGRFGLGPKFAAVVVVVLVFGFLGTIGWIVAAQFTNLTADLPTYTDNLKKKIAQVRDVGSSGSIEKVQEAIKDITSVIEQQLPNPTGQAMPVAQLTEKKSVLIYLPSLLESALTGLMVMVLVIFMLVEQGDVRDRIIAFQGYARLTLTTKALDEVSRRISHYLVLQSLVNGGYGLLCGLGLFALGLPYALLWGFLAATMRFIPYVGVMIGSAVPILFSLAVFPGWTQPILAGCLFLLLELSTSSLLEPMLFGWSTGISKVALLVAVIFWTWLWGPAGLLLSTPSTVCLSVLGNNIPQLAFLGVLLSDKPVKGMNTFYQRLVARSHDEAAEIAAEILKTQNLTTLYDTVVVPALSFLKQDRERDLLTADEAVRIVQATQEIVEDLGPHSPVSAVKADPEEESASSPPPVPVRVVAYPARDESDSLAMRMFQQVCDPARFEVDLLPVSLPLAELFARLAQTPTAILCIGAVSPGGLARTRYLCKRLRGQLPGLTIVVGRWGESIEIAAEKAALLRADGVKYVGTSFREVLDQVIQLIAIGTTATEEEI